MDIVKVKAKAKARAVTILLLQCKLHFKESKVKLWSKIYVDKNFRIVLKKKKKNLFYVTYVMKRQKLSVQYKTSFV